MGIYHFVSRKGNAMSPVIEVSEESDRLLIQSHNQPENDFFSIENDIIYSNFSVNPLRSDAINKALIEQRINNGVS